MLCPYSTALIWMAALWPLILPARAYRKFLRARGHAWGQLWLLDPRLILGGVVWSFRRQAEVEDASGTSMGIGGGKNSRSGGLGIYTEFIFWMIGSVLITWGLLKDYCPVLEAS